MGLTTGLVPPQIASASEATSVVNVLPLTASPTPTITGTAKVGLTLTAVAGTWSPAPVNLTYQWSAGGIPIVGATASTYVVVAANIGKSITVKVTGTKLGYITVSKISLATALVVAGSLTATPTPTITGTAILGLTLTAAPGTWTPAPVVLTYQWYVGGIPVLGATSSTFLLVGLNVGNLVTVTVTGTKVGYVTVSKTSAPTSIGLF